MSMGLPSAPPPVEEEHDDDEEELEMATFNRGSEGRGGWKSVFQRPCCVLSSRRAQCSEADLVAAVGSSP